MGVKFLMPAILISTLWLAPQTALADATTEAQLRAALQQATTQIASLEDQVANLQASQAPDVALIEALKAQMQNASKNSAGNAAANPAEKAKSDAALAALNKQLAARQASLGKSQSAYAAARSAAAASTAQNTVLTTQLASLHTQLNTCDMKNAALYKIGNQILDAYSHKDDVFGAISNREPFIGFNRVQLQNIVQNDQDKLYDNQLAPGATP